MTMLTTIKGVHQHAAKLSTIIFIANMNGKSPLQILEIDRVFVSVQNINIYLKVQKLGLKAKLNVIKCQV